MDTEIVSSIVMSNLGDGHGGPYLSANLEGPRSIYMVKYIFWGWSEVETKAKRGPPPKLDITILLTSNNSWVSNHHCKQIRISSSRGSSTTASGGSGG